MRAAERARPPRRCARPERAHVRAAPQNLLAARQTDGLLMSFQPSIELSENFFGGVRNKCAWTEDGVGTVLA